MTTPTGQNINPPVSGSTVRAELYVDGVKVTATNPIPTASGILGGTSTAGAVTVANGADVAQGSTTDAESTGNGSIIAILKRIRTLLAGTLTTSVANWPASQPVTGTVTANTGLTQPLTDAQLRATALPVSGTFWQPTQPVSLATNTPDVTDRAGRLLGHVTVDNPGLPVTGTFWPATQPVSGTVTANTGLTQPLTDAQLRAAAVPVSLATAPTTPVTGTFWQPTQPVSLATNTPDVTDRAARVLGVVTQQPITKGTQGAAGVTTQDLKDAGRTPVVLSATAVTSVVAETVLSLNQFRAGAATAVTSYTVPAGKTFRLQSIQFGIRFTTPSTTVTFGNARFNLRAGTLVTSPLIFGDSKMAASNTPTPNSDLSVPDGLEFAAGTVLSLWQSASAATMALDALIVGYEY